MLDRQAMLWLVRDRLHRLLRCAGMSDWIVQFQDLNRRFHKHDHVRRILILNEDAVASKAQHLDTPAGWRRVDSVLKQTVTLVRKSQPPVLRRTLRCPTCGDTVMAWSDFRNLSCTRKHLHSRQRWLASTAAVTKSRPRTLLCQCPASVIRRPHVSGVREE